MIKERPSISAFFPAYNDGGTIGSLVVTTLQTLAELTDDYEVLVVENGSTDYTVSVLEELAEKYDHFRYLAHRQALGYGGALRVGFRECRKDLIFYTDGDAQYDPRELKLLLPAMADDIDVVNGWKIERHDPLHRVIIGRMYHHFVKLIFGFKLRDVDCDFRLMRREVFDLIDLESPDGTICLELVKKLQDAGCRFAEVPVHHYHRTYGKSQFFNFRRLSRVLPHVAWLWWKLVVRREHMGRIKTRRRAIETQRQTDKETRSIVR
ncbi:MAG TPA: glycosyltransferase family 2 protein [Kouleothrix sp.]|uniref:glycosyltransferase family 2 protein n=1 Tax=Kouleothrix sp. TaxID=2779161 RepID=UPI002B7C3689|nr:glycosyltransferase family 2 protein [Kouleothrix sp.]HRC76073.1 glycosyltransferase family 2 protein [Kouleothrix sp.]